MGETDYIAIIWEKKHIDKQVQVLSKAMHICAADAIIFCWTNYINTTVW